MPPARERGGFTFRHDVQMALITQERSHVPPSIHRPSRVRASHGPQSRKFLKRWLTPIARRMSDCTDVRDSDRNRRVSCHLDQPPRRLRRDIASRICHARGAKTCLSSWSRAQSVALKSNFLPRLWLKQTLACWRLQ